VTRGASIIVGGKTLHFIEHPLYTVAHPGEFAGLDVRCSRCAFARRSDTFERVLLWCCGGIHWSVSRHEPNPRHRLELQ